MKECNIVKQSPLAGLAAYGGGSGSILFGRKGVGGYTIERSLRLSRADSAHLTRTPSSAGNRRTFTFSAWLKRSHISTASDPCAIFSAGGSSPWGQISFTTDGSKNHLDVSFTAGVSNGTRTSAQFRDASAWYHIVVAVDTTQATASDRIKMYVNGVQFTDMGNTNYPAQNFDTQFNNTNVHRIGANGASSADQFLGGYLADVHFIDGQALAPTEFGETNSNGIWDPKEFTGSFGTNGFHLKFDDASSPAALGTDSSGNNNTFSVNNIKVHAIGLSTADQGFGILTYTGNQTARNISGLSFAPDLVIIKSRSDSAYNHYWVDRVRGTNKNLFSNLTEQEQSADRLSSFNSDGIGLTNHMGVNKTGSEFVAWCWKAGGSASSNSNGTITSSVSASTTYGFSVVGYTGNNTSGATVGHGLSSAPKWIVVKSRDQNGQFWHVYHASLAANEYIYLNSTSAKTSGNDFMNGTRPTSSVFSLGNGNGCNKSSDNVIAYCWSEISGFSKFDSWTGNGSSTGPTITTGFRPRFLLWKRTDSTTNWYIYDTDRQSGNPLNKNLEPNTGDAENTMTSMNIDFLSNGFQIKGTDGDVNANGGTYIYAAFAERPDSDSLFDSPVDGTQSDTGVGGEVSGNYATLNPVAPHGLTLANGNLDGSGSVIQGHAPSTIFASSGKFYCEFTLTTYQNDTGVGVAASIANPGEDWIGEQAYMIGYLADGRLYQNSSYTGYSSYAAGDVIGAAFDADTGKVWFHKNGTYQNSGDPAAGTGQVGTITGGYDLGFTFRAVGGAGSFNFGQRPFAYTAPSGFKALCTTNLPTPTIADGSDYFDNKLYTGNGSTQTISGFNFSPDFVWIKSRPDAYGHALYDQVRGANKRFKTHTNDAEQTQTNGLTSFTSDGFALGDNVAVNDNGDQHISWTWDAGANSDKTYTVKVVSDSGNKYRFDDFGTSAVTLDLEEGSTYVFDQSDSSNSGHPLRFSTTSDGTHGGGSEYTTGVTTTGTPGSAGAKTTIVVAASAPTLFYYCSVHSGMGGQANTNSTAGASNFDGSIQATAKANQTAGFSIATISSATGSTTADLGHGLNAQPHFIIQKSRTNTYSWQVYHIGSGSYRYGNLNGTGQLSSATTGNMGITPNSSTVGLGSDFTGSNDYVYYIFAPVAGYSAFGAYTGNGSTDGPFVYTGMRPAWILVRSTSSNRGWVIWDTSRDPHNVADANLFPNNANAESSSSDHNIDILSNGFKLRTTSSNRNGSGETYIYAAFAENPFKTARAR